MFVTSCFMFIYDTKPRLPLPYCLNVKAYLTLRWSLLFCDVRMNVTYVSMNQKCEVMIDMLYKSMDCYDSTEQKLEYNSSNPFVEVKHIEGNTKHWIWRINHANCCTYIHCYYCSVIHISYNYVIMNFHFSCHAQIIF